MSFWKNSIDKLQEDIVVSIGNPKTFDTNWAFTSSRFRFLSLIALILLLFSIAFSLFLFFGPTKSWFTTNDVSIDRQNLEAQSKQVMQLEAKIASQDEFIKNIQQVLLGKVSADSVYLKPKNIEAFDMKDVNLETTKDEGKLARKVRDDMRTKQSSEKESITSSMFDAPVKGYLSEKFSSDRHPAVDIVCKKEAIIKACLDGIILYTSYSKNDGYMMIIVHGNGYISIYKHNKINLKKTGQRVQLGDPIAIAGNTGENSTGPHLHFELWYQQMPVDPATLMRFN